MTNLHVLLMAAFTSILWTQSAFANVIVLHDGSDKNDIGGTILIHSEIKNGDFAAFKKAAERLKLILSDPRDAVPFIKVELDSPGGDVMEAIQIGRLIHERFMMTVVMPERECASACVFILIAGATRDPTNLAHVGLHRPRFDAAYFANLSAEQARSKYNDMTEGLRKYYIKEMGGSEEAFRLIMATPSDQIHFLTVPELEKLGLRGQDPAWEEFLDAQSIKHYGPVRWPFIKKCIAPSGDIDGCVTKAYEQYPDK